MPTVTTSTSSLDVQVSYICSKCGTPNTFHTKLSAMGSNAYQSGARLQTIINELNTKDVTERYNNANLKHKCHNCKHQEPWSGLDLNKKKGYAIMCAIVSGLLFLTPAGTIVKYGNILTLVPLLVVFSIPTLLFVLSRAMKKKSVARKMAALPVESMPYIQAVPKETFTADDVMRMLNQNM